MMQGDDPPFLQVGTDVSAKYKGAFCEAKISKVVRALQLKITYNSPGLGSGTISEEQIKFPTGIYAVQLRPGQVIQVKHPDKSKEFVNGTINRIRDLSQYTVVFDDGDITTLRRTALCLKSGRHFNENETLDHLPLTHPEHFSNPVGVVAGRRGRRCRQNNDGSDLDDEIDDGDYSHDRSRSSSRAHSLGRDVGKVVLFETSDTKRKSKDSFWSPGLIVAPTASGSHKINTREECLIRSFKDGRYYTVPRKEVADFKREPNRVDSPTLTMAVDKAISFLDRAELPQHWDKDTLFALNNPGDSDSEANYSESSDDESREEKDHFVAQLYKFMDDRSTPINKCPTIANRDLDLCRLFRLVGKLGGYNGVTNKNKWRYVTQRLGFSKTHVGTVKHAYYRILQPFEEFERKLGMTMISSPRSGQSRPGGGRSLIRDRDRVNTPVQQRASTSAASSPKLSVSTPGDRNDRKASVSAISASTDEEKSNTAIETAVEKKVSEKRQSPESIKAEPTSSEQFRKKRKLTPNAASSAVTSKRLSTQSTNENASDSSSSESNAAEVASDVSSVSVSSTAPKRKKLGMPLCAAKKKLPAPNLSPTRPVRKFKLKSDTPTTSEIKALKESKNDVEKADVKPVVSTAASTRSSSKESVSKRKNSTSSVSSLPEKNISTSKTVRATSVSIASNSSSASINIKKENVDEVEKKQRGRKKKEPNAGDTKPPITASKTSDSETPSSPFKSSISNMSTPPTGGISGTSKTPFFTGVVNIGDKLKVYYGPNIESKVTYEAKLLEIDKDEMGIKYFVHYTGWNNRYDEWIRPNRIAENCSLNTKTKRSASNKTPTNPPNNAGGSKTSAVSATSTSAASMKKKLVKRGSVTSLSSGSASTRVGKSDTNSLKTKVKHPLARLSKSTRSSRKLSARLAKQTGKKKHKVERTADKTAAGRLRRQQTTTTESSDSSQSSSDSDQSEERDELTTRKSLQKSKLHMRQESAEDSDSDKDDENNKNYNIDSEDKSEVQNDDEDDGDDDDTEKEENKSIMELKQQGTLRAVKRKTNAVTREKSPMKRLRKLGDGKRQVTRGNESFKAKPVTPSSSSVASVSSSLSSPTSSVIETATNVIVNISKMPNLSTSRVIDSGDASDTSSGANNTNNSNLKPKGRDFDLNQIRSELKGLDKSKTGLGNLSGSDSDTAAKTTSITNISNIVESKVVIGKIDDAKKALDTFKKSELLQGTRETITQKPSVVGRLNLVAEDIYTFTEPEPFEATLMPPLAKKDDKTKVRREETAKFKSPKIFADDEMTSVQGTPIKEISSSEEDSPSLDIASLDSSPAMTVINKQQLITYSKQTNSQMLAKKQAALLAESGTNSEKKSDDLLTAASKGKVEKIDKAEKGENVEKIESSVNDAVASTSKIALPKKMATRKSPAKAKIHVSVKKRVAELKKTHLEKPLGKQLHVLKAKKQEILLKTGNEDESNVSSDSKPNEPLKKNDKLIGKDTNESIEVKIEKQQKPLKSSQTEQSIGQISDSAIKMMALFDITTLKSKFEDDAKKSSDASEDESDPINEAIKRVIAQSHDDSNDDQLLTTNLLADGIKTESKLLDIKHEDSTSVKEDPHSSAKLTATDPSDNLKVKDEKKFSPQLKKINVELHAVGDLSNVSLQSPKRDDETTKNRKHELTVKKEIVPVVSIPNENLLSKRCDIDKSDSLKNDKLNKPDKLNCKKEDEKIERTEKAKAKLSDTKDPSGVQSIAITIEDRCNSQFVVQKDVKPGNVDEDITIIATSTRKTNILNLSSSLVGNLPCSDGAGSVENVQVPASTAETIPSTVLTSNLQKGNISLKPFSVFNVKERRSSSSCSRRSSSSSDNDAWEDDGLVIDTQNVNESVKNESRTVINNNAIDDVSITKEPISARVGSSSPALANTDNMDVIKDDEADSNISLLLCEETIPGSPAPATSQDSISVGNTSDQEDVGHDDVEINSRKGKTSSPGKSTVSEMPFASAPGVNKSRSPSEQKIVAITTPATTTATISSSSSTNKSPVTITANLLTSRVNVPVTVSSSASTIKMSPVAAPTRVETQVHLSPFNPSGSFKEHAPSPLSSPETRDSVISMSPKRELSPACTSDSASTSKLDRDIGDINEDYRNIVRGQKNFNEEESEKKEDATSCSISFAGVPLTSSHILKKKKSVKGSEMEVTLVTSAVPVIPQPAKRGRKPNALKLATRVTPTATNSESDDDSEHSNSVNITRSPSIDAYRSTASSSNTQNPCTSFKSPTKFIYASDIDPRLDSNQRIALIYDKMMELKKLYSEQKAEMAAVERRLKKLRRREREGKNNTCSTLGTKNRNKASLRNSRSKIGTNQCDG